MDQKVSVIIERDDTHFFAYCPELQDCRAEGETVENTLANMKQAIALYLQRLEKEEIMELTSREIYTTTLSITFD